MNSSAADAHERLLSNPEFWETFPGFFFDDDKLLEFATVIGVSAEYIRAKRLEQWPWYVMKITAPHIGNDTKH